MNAILPNSSKFHLEKASQRRFELFHIKEKATKLTVQLTKIVKIPPHKARRIRKEQPPPQIEVNKFKDVCHVWSTIIVEQDDMTSAMGYFQIT